jgi:uncharacterized membrane protein YdbT with pleckstrin-like domain
MPQPRGTSMSYVSRVLQPEERVVYVTKLHWFVYLRMVFWLVVAALVAIGSSYAPSELQLPVLIAAGAIVVIALLYGLDAYVKRATTELAITDRRVIYKTGLIRRHTFEMNLSKVESVGVTQSIFGRLFGFGEVEIKGTGASLTPIPRISDPLSFRSHITASA